MKRIIIVIIFVSCGISYTKAQTMSQNEAMAAEIDCDNCFYEAIDRDRKKIEQRKASGEIIYYSGVSFDTEYYNDCIEKCYASQQQHNNPAVQIGYGGRYRISGPSQKTAVSVTDTPANLDSDQPVATHNVTSGVAVMQGTGMNGRIANNTGNNIIRRNEESQQKQMNNIKKMRDARIQRYNEWYKEQQRKKEEEIQKRAAKYVAEMQAHNAEVTNSLMNAVQQNKAYGSYLKNKNTVEEIGNRNDFSTGSSVIKNLKNKNVFYEYYLVDEHNNEYYISNKAAAEIAGKNVYAIEGSVDADRYFIYDNPHPELSFNLYYDYTQAENKKITLNIEENNKWTAGVKYKIEGQLHIPDSPTGSFDDGSIELSMKNAIKEGMQNSTLKIVGDATYYRIQYNVIQLKLALKPVAIPNSNSAQDEYIGLITNGQSGMQKGTLRTHIPVWRKIEEPQKQQQEEQDKTEIGTTDRPK
ncbi:MAG: hypothetical protein LBG15_15675 [Dysgonamonadaceae bacterium]|jgi:hypothetical protein|nr:hypothetical protein [Dysgonamonadaceae bacterium]